MITSKRFQTVAGILTVCLLVGLVFPGPGPATERSVVRQISDLDHHNRSAGTFRALVVGINEYDDPDIEDLDTAVADAKAVAEVLKEGYGFTVRTLINGQATKAKLYDALRNLAAAASPNDSILIYYAGHGEIDLQFESEDGWWIPADARANQKYTYFDNVLVQHAIAKTKARHVLLISDSCYAGTLFGKQRSLPPDITERYYLKMFNEQSRWGLTSGNKTPVSDAGSAGHSLFAYQLLKHLCQNERPYMSTQELYVKIAPIIGNNSSQTPVCRPIKGVNDLGGELVFIRKGRTTDGITACNPFPLFADSGGTQIIIPPAEPTPARPGRLTVKSSVPGATVAINGQTFEGPLPKTFTIKQKGRYDVRVTRSGYEPYQDTVEMGLGETRELTAHLEKIDPGPVEPVAPVRPPDGEPKPGDTWTEPTTGMVFVWVPGGCYQMGSNDGDSDEKPVHRVCVDGFWMGRTEVTNGQFVAFLNAVGRRGPSGEPWFDTKDEDDDSGIIGQPGRFHVESGYEDHPVVEVSWYGARAMAEWLTRHEGRTYRLPTESEWEYAARAGTTTPFTYGRCLSTDQANYDGNYPLDGCGKGEYRERTIPVGSLNAPNAWGLHDMHGNVWEWCQDWFGDYPSGSVTDPTGPSSGKYRVLRGGGWYNNARDCRSATRYRNTAHNRINDYGFRLVSPPGQ